MKPLVKVKVGEALAAEEALKPNPVVPAEAKAGRALAAGEALKLKAAVLAEVKAGEAPKRVGMLDGLPNAKPKVIFLIESDFSSTPLESFITHPVNVSLFSVEYLSTGMDVFSIHLSSVESYHSTDNNLSLLFLVPPST